MRGKRRPDSGFSLIETLVVVFIIGMVASLVVVALPRGESPQEEAAGKLRRSMLLARDAALTTGLPHAVEVSEEGWVTVRLERGEWVAASALGKGGIGRMPAETRLELTVAEARTQDAATDRYVSRSQRQAQRNATGTAEPEPATRRNAPQAERFWFDPVGQSLPGEVRLEGRGGPMKVVIAADGSIVVEGGRR